MKRNHLGSNQYKTIKRNNHYVAKFMLILFGVIIVYGAFMFFTEEKIIYQTVVEQVEIEAPVLNRIAKCESGNSHYSKNGQVLVIGNENKSVDVGKYQINQQIWGAKATELKLNLFVEKDNEEFAKYLYRTYGTEPWVWSKKCWR